MKTVLGHLARQAKTRPDRPMFSDERETLTFFDAAARSDRIGSALLRRGACREPVLVFMRRGGAMIAAFFGVWKANCFYVPVDAEMGESRIRSILDRVKPRFAVADESAEALLDTCGFSGEALDAEAILSEPVDNDALEAAAKQTLDSDPAYLVFTSGSTGAPKGVVGVHRAVCDYAEQITKTLQASEEDVFGMQAPLYVDACLKEILSALKCGSSVVLVPKKLFMTPVPLVEFLNAHRVTALCWVVPALTLISALHTFDAVVPQHLRTVAFGSEVMPPKQLRIWKEHIPARYLNLYGPTECTGMSCFYEVDRDFSDGERIPIGLAFDNTEIFLIDENGNRADEGEIYIRGTCVCHGYYRDPERTKNAFVQNPLNPDYPETVYRTGDLGRINDRGELEFLGRRDDQIKHMGHRIELGELEAAARTVDGVNAACAVFDREKSVLGLVYTGAIEKTALLTALRATLPEYLLPKRTAKVDALPLTENGKTDRKAATLLLYR
ncbi:MAG: amino acid adenylation domain-containing protein [Clostridia bacterium]|nr:amino acid adenylation domain-containing protein [Clostridia bacterium]